jgi:DNA-binding NtrC family response regulator
MMYSISATEQVTVLASAAGWAWPLAVQDIFEPRGVNLILADNVDEFVNIVGQRRVHAAIMDSDVQFGGTGAIKVVRMVYPWLPCVLLRSAPDEDFLERALQLDVFSVICKPVDMKILREQLDRLFTSRYNSEIFTG